MVCRRSHTQRCVFSLILLAQDISRFLMGPSVPDQHGRCVWWFTYQFMGYAHKAGQSLQVLISRDVPIKENNPYV
jgi:hypothetical protein